MITDFSSLPPPQEANALSAMEVMSVGMTTWEHPQHDEQLQYWPSIFIFFTLGLHLICFSFHDKMKISETWYLNLDSEKEEDD